MTTTTLDATAPAVRPSRRRALWTLQVLLALFMIGASALPKLLGESYAVQSFDDIGAGQWLRHLVGVLELAGGIGLLVAPLAGLAAACFVALMVGAAFTQLVVLDAPAYALTPVTLGVLFAVVAVVRREEIRALPQLVHRRGSAVRALRHVLLTSTASTHRSPGRLDQRRMGASPPPPQEDP